MISAQIRLNDRLVAEIEAVNIDDDPDGSFGPDVIRRYKILSWYQTASNRWESVGT